MSIKSLTIFVYELKKIKNKTIYFYNNIFIYNFLLYTSVIYLTVKYKKLLTSKYKFTDS